MVKPRSFSLSDQEPSHLLLHTISALADIDGQMDTENDSVTAGGQQDSGNSDDESGSVLERASTSRHLIAWCQGLERVENGPPVEIGVTGGSGTGDGRQRPGDSDEQSLESDSSQVGHLAGYYENAGGAAVIYRSNVEAEDIDNAGGAAGNDAIPVPIVLVTPIENGSAVWVADKALGKNQKGQAATVVDATIAEGMVRVRWDSRPAWFQTDIKRQFLTHMDDIAASPRKSRNNGSRLYS
jgi:hypothetical protein